MDSVGNSVYNEYEQDVSPFGRKVMIALLKLKEERNNKSCKAFCPPSQNRYQNRRVLEFNNLSPPKSQLYSHNVEDRITVEENNINIENVSIHRTNHSQLVSTSSDLLKAPDHCILREGTIKQTLDETLPYPLIEDTITSNNNKQDDTPIAVDLGFDQILNVNDIFRCVGDDIIDIDTNKLDDQGKNKPAIEDHASDDLENANDLPRETARRKNDRNDECCNAIKNKTNLTKYEKKSYRKLKYTTAVKSWLKDTRPLNNVDVIGTNESPEEICAPKKKNKKTVQAQLTNKDGVMKYRKPKEKIKDTTNNTNDGEDVTETPAESSAGKIRQKKSKPRFVAPIKSQLPVDDIKYHIDIIDDADCKHFEDTDVFLDQEILATLIFSNGSCQLDSRPSDSTRTPEGIMLHFHESFYYFKDLSTVRNVFARLTCTNTLVCYDAKKVINYLNCFEEALPLDIFDVKIAGHLISPQESLDTFSELLKFLSMSPEYAICTECAMQSTARYMTLLKESSQKLRATMIEYDLYRLFVNIEMKILPILADMERRGVCVDTEILNATGTVLMTRMKEIEAECYRVAGKSFQINSTVQVRTILYDELKLDSKCNIKIRETISKGAKSTSEAMLRSLGELHPLPRLILEYRHVHKAHSTFVAGIARHVVDGLVKPTCGNILLPPPPRDQSAAVTGRISSSDPNLQAIPKTFNLVLFPQNDVASQSLNLRGAYRSGAGRRLLCADYRQLECRVLAAAASDHRLQAALSADDLFTELAALWLHRAPCSVSAGDRERTKRLVYAALYGAGPSTLASILQLDYQHVLEVIASFNRTFPSLKSFGKSVVSECARGGGRLRTATGRTRTFNNINSEDAGLKAQAERQAVNFIIQGTAADVCKLATCVCGSRLAEARVAARLLVTVHDELLWEVPDDQLHRAAAIIKSAMESCGRECGLDSALPVAMYCGRSWGEMEEYVAPENTDKE